MSERKYTYLFADILSNRVLDELPAYGTWFSKQLGDAGNMTATIPMNAAPFSNGDLKNATTPGKTALYALCNDAVVWSGPIWTRTYNSQARALSLTGQTWESWGNKFYPDQSLSYVSVEQRNIVIDLFTKMQNNPLQNANITLPSTYPLQVARTENFPFEDLKSYAELIEYLSEYDQGFDYEILSYMDGSGILRRELSLGSPQLGRVQALSNVMYEYPGSIIDYYYTENASNSAVKAWGVGGAIGDNTAPIRSSYTQADLVASGAYPLLQAVFTNGDVTNQATLDAQTKLFGNSKRTPVVSWSIDVDPALDPVLGTWNLGDEAAISIEDEGFFEDPYTGTVRIVGWELTPPSSDNKESLKLLIEGSSDGGG